MEVISPPLHPLCAARFILRSHESSHFALLVIFAHSHTLLNPDLHSTMQQIKSIKSTSIRHLQSSRAIKPSPPRQVKAKDGLVEAFTSYLGPQAETFKALDLPEALIHWGHPGNMAIVLLAMGGYGALYQGWQIRTATDINVIQAAKDSHPKLAAGMAFFFAAGGLGGITSLLMQGKPILESPHALTGAAGLSLLLIQASLPLFFGQGQTPRDVHAYLGTSLMALFVVHLGLGVQLGLSI